MSGLPWHPVQYLWPSIESIVLFLGFALTVSPQFMCVGECHGSLSTENSVWLVVSGVHIDPRLMVQRILICFYARHLKLCLANLSLIKNKATESALNSSIATIDLFNLSDSVLLHSNFGSDCTLEKRSVHHDWIWLLTDLKRDGSIQNCLIFCYLNWRVFEIRQFHWLVRTTNSS